MSSTNFANAAANRCSNTEVRTERIVHKWSIKKFNLLPGGVGRTIYSPWFYSRDESEKWRLKFYPHGQHNSLSGGIQYVSLYLVRASRDKSQITAYTEMSISKSNKILKFSSSTHEYEPQDITGYGKFLERSKLLTKNSSDDDRFTISCTIEIPTEVITSSSDATIFHSDKRQLSDDFRYLFKSSMFSDFTIIVGDEKFAAHKVVLAARSPVFAAMFKHKSLEENVKKEMKIPYIEPDVIEGMLEFIYTDEVTNLKGLAIRLLEVADKYDLEKLKAMCEKTLYEGIYKGTAILVLQLADLYHAETLKKYVMKYIVEHAPAMIKSNNWKMAGLSHELLLELTNQLAFSQVANNEDSSSSRT